MNTMRYFRFFQDLWRFFKDHSNPVSADIWWQLLVEEADHLADRYGDTEFVRKMISAAVWEIDSICQKRNDAKTGERR